MSFTIKPVNAFLTKDMDTITKMDPYVYLTIGARKYKSKAHMGGGKTPYWMDIFEVPVIMSPSELQMKVQLYDKDIIKDDFIGEGWFDLSMLLNTPGKTENLYIDLIRKGKPAGRVLLQMTYNGPYPNQGLYMNQPQYQGWKQKANKYIKGYGTKATYPSSSYGYNQQTPFYNQTNQPQKGYQNPYNTGWGSQVYNQPGMQSQGQNKQNMWNQPSIGGNYPGSKNIPPTQNYPNQQGWNPNQQQWSQNSGW